MLRASSRPVMRPFKRHTDHLQSSGHAHLFDFPGLGELALEVHMLKAGKRV
ncbi:hypothetical protein [Halomonas sp. ATBC28]|uniref:hypothetical protein n=1 Tax=Halomonas sp. ATBC28 TaxID=2545264 RepID=UPI00148629DC|nr:hypothetical protein [Halomonas sp. ATBC28]